MNVLPKQERKRWWEKMGRGWKERREGGERKEKRKEFRGVNVQTEISPPPHERIEPMPTKGQEMSFGIHTKQKYVIVTFLFQVQKSQVNHELEKVPP